jgi:AcrR family transcriptional regulator
MPNASPRTPQHERRARTRSRLVRAAGKVFAERGYHGATLDDVVAEAGVSRGALYHHFGSKQELFLALLHERLTAGITDADTLLQRHDVEADAVSTAAAGFLGRIERDARWLPLLLEFLATGGRDPDVRAGVVTHFMRPARQQAAAIIRRTDPDVAASTSMSPEELAVGVTALINGLAIERAFDPDAVPPDLPGRLLAALTNGICQP